MQCCRNPEIQPERTASAKIKRREWTWGMRDGKWGIVAGVSQRCHPSSPEAQLHHLLRWAFLELLQKRTSTTALTPLPTSSPHLSPFRLLSQTATDQGLIQTFIAHSSRG